MRGIKGGNDSPRLILYQEFFFPKSSRERLESFQPGAFSEDHVHAWEGWAVHWGTLSPESHGNCPSLLPHHGIIIIFIFVLLSHQRKGNFLRPWSRFYLFLSGCQVEGTHY